MNWAIVPGRGDFRLGVTQPRPPYRGRNARLGEEMACDFADAHEALLWCAAAAGPPGAYNIAADGIVTAGTVARELGIASFPVSPRLIQAPARALAALPFLSPVAQWVEAASHPAIMDTTRAKTELGWAPEFTALETLRDTLRPYRRQAPRPGRSATGRTAASARRSSR